MQARFAIHAKYPDKAAYETTANLRVNIDYWGAILENKFQMIVLRGYIGEMHRLLPGQEEHQIQLL